MWKNLRGIKGVFSAGITAVICLLAARNFGFLDFVLVHGNPAFRRLARQMQDFTKSLERSQAKPQKEIRKVQGACS